MVKKLKVKNLWLDKKIFDIPNTSFAAIKSLRDLKNISYITVHISGGLEMLKAVKKASKNYNRKLKIEKRLKKLIQQNLLNMEKL